MGDQIRGEFWRVKAKRLVRSRKKVFEHNHWKLAPEIHIPLEANNSEIFTLINQYLLDCQTELKKKRYIDSSKLKAIGPYVDWRNLINKNISD